MAAPRVKVGADVLPWWPATGVYLLLETGATPPADLADVDGVGGVWSATSQRRRRAAWRVRRAGQLLTYCFLDDDPVATAERLRPVLDDPVGASRRRTAARGALLPRRAL